MYDVKNQDCLTWLPAFRGACQLVYIDPPYNTGQTFYHKDGSIAYYDKWELSIDYQQWLALRLQECWRALASDGSLWVHTDWHCDYLVRGLLDEICDKDNYRNQIAWCYTLPRADRDHLPRNHQTIYYYALPAAKLNTERIPYSDASRKSEGKPKGYPGSGAKQKIYTLHEEGKLLNDWWNDIPITQARHGYPTEKPLALLERIVKLSSDEGRLVIDPMAGSGVALEAAKRLNRQYAGCDTNPQAVQMAISRLAAIPAVQPSLGAAT